MNEKFYDLEWHDARMINFQIGENSGKQEIVLDMEWPEDPPSKVIFKEVCGCQFKGGVRGICLGGILTVDIISVGDSKWEWPEFNDKEVVCFCISWGHLTYNDEIKIFAKYFEHQI